MTEEEVIRPKHGAIPAADDTAPPAKPEDMSEDAPPGVDEDERELASELGDLADADNSELARAKKRLRKIIENGRL